MKSLDSVYLHVTRACNLRCSYCYFEAGTPVAEELDTAEMISLLGQIGSLKPSRIVITGGEPLLRADILTLLRELKTCAPDSQTAITTNGMLIDTEMAKKLVEHVDEVRVSIDSFRDINDSIRGKDSFDGAMDALSSLRATGSQPVAFVTVTAVNAPRLGEFMRFLIRNGISRIHLSPLRLVGRAANADTVGQAEDTTGTIKTLCSELLGKQLEDPAREHSTCGIGRLLCIHPDGSVYPCHVLARPGFCLGNTRATDLRSILGRLGAITSSGVCIPAECPHEDDIRALSWAGYASRP